MKKIKAGVIGVGYLGRFHAQKYASLENVDLIGVADTDPKQAEKVAKECGSAPFTDYKELLKKVDAVSIVVPTTYHHKVALDCIDQNVDMLLEKPMTVTTEEAEEVVEKAEEKKLVLQVGHLERFNPAVLAIKPFLTAPVFIESNRITTFKNRGVDVDVVLDLMIHDIDIILSIVQSPILDIHTIGAPVATQTTDIANARLIFENGATANITVSRVSRVNTRKMRIFQPNSYINVDFANKKVMTIELQDELMENGMPKQDVKVKKFPQSDALKDEVVHFINCVEKRSRPMVSGYEGKQALDVALQVIRQIKEHQKKEVFKQFNQA